MQESEKEFLISFKDLTYLLKKNIKIIGITTLICSSLTAFIILRKPITYPAKATFLEKGKSKPSLDGSLLSSLLSSMPSSEEMQAKSIMTSRSLLKEVSKKLALQATITPKSGNSFFYRAKRNLINQIKYKSSLPTEIFPEDIKDIVVSKVDYPSSSPTTLRIKFLSENQYLVKTSDKEKIGKGSLGNIFKEKDFSFVLEKKGKKPIKGKTYLLSLYPLNYTAEQLSKRIVIEADKKNPSLLEISFADQDKDLAARFVNEVMFAYQNFLKKESARQAQLQLAYLEKRQNQMAKRLKEVMEEHAKIVSEDLSSKGFPNTQTELEFFTKMQTKWRQQLVSIELDINRIKQQTDKSNDIEHLSFPLKPALVSLNLDTTNAKIANELRELLQQRDSLSIKLLSYTNDKTKNVKENFYHLIDDLNKMDKQTVEISQSLCALEKDCLPNATFSLYQDQNLFTNIWFQEIKDTQEKIKSGDQDVLAQYQMQKQTFRDYLINLQHLIDVRKNLIKERLKNQHHLEEEFQGLDLNMVHSLYMEYSKQLNQNETEQNQLRFTLSKIENPNFEISSLSNILKDSVTQKMIQKTSELLLSLRDSANRSEKEQNRIKQELNIQKGFLKTHITQVIDLIELKQKVLREKIQKLQSVKLELINQKISLLEHQLTDRRLAKLANLEEEKKLLESHLIGLKKDMAQLPKRWVSEQLTNQWLKINEKSVEEITRLVESKNIAYNMEMIHSRPLDLAIPSTLPSPPKLFLMSLLGAFLGMFLSTGFVITRALKNGLPVTGTSLEINNACYAGNLTDESDKEPLLDNDLETLRNILHLSDDPKEKTKTLLTLIDKGTDYSFQLASLLQKQGKKPLIIDLEKTSDTKNGLFNYLNCEIDQPKIHSQNGIDIIKGGKFSRFSAELLQKERFRKLIDKFKQSYDKILIVSSKDPLSVEAKMLISLFDRSVISIKDKTIYQIEEYINNKQIIFITI